MNLSQPHSDTRSPHDIATAARVGLLATEEDTSAALARLAALAREDAAHASPRAWSTPHRFYQLSVATLAALLGALADMPEMVAVANLPRLVDLRALAESVGGDAHLRICEAACTVLESARDDEASVTARGG